MSKAGGRAIGVGCFLMLLGLCFLPAAFQEKKDPTMLGAGICLFAFGALVAAGGFYLAARALQSGTPAADLKKVPTRRVRGGCDLCGGEMPVILCRVHEVHLCGQCLADHYDFRSCAYVPSSRRAPIQKALSRVAGKA